MTVIFYDKGSFSLKESRKIQRFQKSLNAFENKRFMTADHVQNVYKMPLEDFQHKVRVFELKTDLVYEILNSYSRKQLRKFYLNNKDKIDEKITLSDFLIVLQCSKTFAAWLVSNNFTNRCIKGIFDLTEEQKMQFCYLVEIYFSMRLMQI